MSTNHDLNRYIRVHDPLRPGEFTGEHIVIAERALGKKLPPRAETHHLSGQKGDNRNQNLIICEDRSYHRLIERRQKVYEAGGDPNTQIFCGKCGLLRLIGESICVECSKQRQKDHRRELYLTSISLPVQVREQLEEYSRLTGDPFWNRDEIYRMIDDWKQELAVEEEKYFMSDTENRGCLYPNCRYTTRGDKHKGARGLCNHHYGIAHSLVIRGKITWDSLEAKGMVNAPLTFGYQGADLEAREYFLSEPELAEEDQADISEAS